MSFTLDQKRATQWLNCCTSESQFQQWYAIKSEYCSPKMLFFNANSNQFRLQAGKLLRGQSLKKKKKLHAVQQGATMLHLCQQTGRKFSSSDSAAGHPIIARVADSIGLTNIPSSIRLHTHYSRPKEMSHPGSGTSKTKSLRIFPGTNIPRCLCMNECIDLCVSTIRKTRFPCQTTMEGFQDQNSQNTASTSMK